MFAHCFSRSEKSVNANTTSRRLQDYNREGYEDLMDFVDRVSLKDGDKFCATLMRESFRHKGLGQTPAPSLHFPLEVQAPCLTSNRTEIRML